MDILLGRKNVNPDKLDNKGRAPLSFAAERGHEGVVKILPGRGEVNAEKPDNSGQTPLSHAEKHGYYRVVALLESHKPVTPSTI